MRPVAREKFHRGHQSLDDVNKMTKFKIMITNQSKKKIFCCKVWSKAKFSTIRDMANFSLLTPKKY